MVEAQLYKGHVPVTHFDSLHPSVCATCAWNDLWQDGQRSKHGFLHGYLYHLAYPVLQYNARIASNPVGVVACAKSIKSLDISVHRGWVCMHWWRSVWLRHFLDVRSVKCE